VSLFLAYSVLFYVITASNGIKTNKKGSFLLSSNPTDVKVAAVIDGVKRKNDKGGKNDEVGKDLIKLHNKHMGPNVAVFYKQDGGLVIEKGQGVHMVDIDGNLHLDCCNNVASVGHAHPSVVAAGNKALSAIQTNGRFLHRVRQQYVSKILTTLPPDLDTIYFVNSGSEANDLALRIAREATTSVNPKDVLILDSAYHGHTQSLVDISPYKWYQAVDGKNYKPNTTHVAALPDAFRGKYRCEGEATEEIGALYAKDVATMVDNIGGVGTFIAESIVGCGGQVVPPPTYLKRVYETVRKYGGICIADEVQTGFARPGTNFWMFQDHSVVPDIVTCGKPMGNGYPVAAVICKRSVAEKFAATGIEYFNTYGGNSVACSIAEAVFDTIKSEKLQENALEVGAYLKEQLNTLMVYDWVGDVRGSGLFQGIEFVLSRQNRADLQPHPHLTKFIVDFLRYNNVVISRDGPDENVIKVKPPLVFSKANVDTLVSTIRLALDTAIENKLFPLADVPVKKMTLEQLKKKAEELVAELNELSSAPGSPMRSPPSSPTRK